MINTADNEKLASSVSHDPAETAASDKEWSRMGGEKYAKMMLAMRARRELRPSNRFLLLSTAENSVGRTEATAIGPLAQRARSMGLQQLEFRSAQPPSLPIVIEAEKPELEALLSTTPGIKAEPIVLVYPQSLQTFATDHEEARLRPSQNQRSRKLSVHVIDTAGNALAGIETRAYLNAGDNFVSARTDQDGIATLRIPLDVAYVDALTVEPQHTYWSAIRAGFFFSARREPFEVTLSTVLPDSFNLMSRYTDYDETAGKGVRVGIIDSGIGPHDSLRVFGGSNFVTGEDRQNFQDNGIGHGTHVAGIIAAKKMPNGSGVYGVAPACELYSYRVTAYRQTAAEDTDIVSAIERAIADGCHLLNISMGTPEPMPRVESALARADAAGMIVVTAAGNLGADELHYPARYVATQCVGALGWDATFPDDSVAGMRSARVRQASEFIPDFSCIGPNMCFVGPGVGMISTFPGNLYAEMSGTSMSTPFTTGQLARLLSRNPQVLTMPASSARTSAIMALVTNRVRLFEWPAHYQGRGVICLSSY